MKESQALQVTREVRLTREDVAAVIAKQPIPHVTLTAREANRSYSIFGPSPGSHEPRYVRTFAFHQNDIPSFARLINIQPNESVLDLGTGIGWLLYELRRLQSAKTGYQPEDPPRFVGIDACKPLIDAVNVRQRNEPRDSIYKSLEFLEMDMVELVNIGGPFNVITGCWVLQCLLTNLRRPAFNRWKQLLAPGGRLIMDFQGNAPSACATDIRYSSEAPPLRTFLLLQEEINRMAEEYRLLVAGTNTGFDLDRPTGFKILGISNRARALGRKQDYDGVGHLDDSDILDQLIHDFNHLARRKPTLPEIQHIKGVYIANLLGRVQQAAPRPGTVRCDVKNLALVGIWRLP